MFFVRCPSFSGIKENQDMYMGYDFMICIHHAPGDSK